MQISDWLTAGSYTIGVLLLLYLVRVNTLMKGVPDEVRKIAGDSWTPGQLRNVYEKLKQQPPGIRYKGKLPPRLHRRYIVTGGNGLVGGFIVLQLLARGTPPQHIRILDIRQPERSDMADRIVREVDFIQTDIASAAAVEAAFSKPWNKAAAQLPLTVFHTAAVILVSDRSKYMYGFPEAVNIRGTQNVLDAARKFGADIFSSTSSGSISILPVQPFVRPWAKQPHNFWQILDERDFFQPLRPHDDYFGNYPATKAKAERIVCSANSEDFRTGCIRPANGVYGNPTDNTVGDPLSRSVLPTWVSHIVQNFVHGANVGIAHLQHEAVLVDKNNTEQAGRPFVVTDPNPPITYSDIYTVISTLSNHPFITIPVPPVLLLLLSYPIEWYNLLPFRYPFLKRWLPKLEGDLKHLQPGIFAICTHLIGVDKDARKPVEEGGLGYEGVITTLEGMASEVLEWNREHASMGSDRKPYTSSVSLADQLQKLGLVGSTVNS